MRQARPFCDVGRSLVLALLVSVIFVAAGPATSASAHATLLFASPTVDGAVPTSPKSLQLVFDEAVVPSASSLYLEDSSGRAFDLGAAVSGDKGLTITASVTNPLPGGQYLVRWQVGAQDGDTMRGEYHFAVGSASALTPGAVSVQTGGLVQASLLRWLLFGGLSLALGGLVGSRLASRAGRQAEALTPPRSWALAGAIMGVVASAGLALAFLGGGSLWHGATRFSIEALMSSPPGRLAALEVVAFVLAAFLLWRERRLLAGALLMVVPVAEALRAHPHGAMPVVGALLTGVHLAAAAVWVGALVHVVRVGRARRRVGLPAAGLVRSYARLALWLFLAVVLSGSLSVLVLVSPSELASTLLGTSYGRWLAIKVAFVAGVAGLALIGRRTLRLNSDRAQPPRAARYESAVLLVILGISGLLTSLAPPVPSDAPYPFPPPAVGPVVSVGGRSGLIGLGLTASEGQLLVRLTTPDASPGVDSGVDPSLKLAGNLVPGGGGHTHELHFRGCGPGCFVAPTTWIDGLSTITLRATSNTWPGGTAAVNIAWPPRPATQRLKSIVRNMRAVPQVVVHEQVTSDTTTGAGSATLIRLSGQDYLSTGPYGSGKATTATLLSESRESTTIALGYPAVSTYVLLTVDAEERIIRETLAGPNHLVSRTFVYPAADAE